MSTAVTNKQQKRNRTQTTDIHFKTSTWKSLVNPWRALSTHVETRRIGAKILLASFKEHLRRSDGKLVNIDGQNTPFDLTKDIFGMVKRKS